MSEVKYQPPFRVSVFDNIIDANGTDVPLDVAVSALNRDQVSGEAVAWLIEYPEDEELDYEREVVEHESSARSAAERGATVTPLYTHPAPTGQVSEEMVRSAYEHGALLARRPHPSGASNLTAALAAKKEE